MQAQLYLKVVKTSLGYMGKVVAYQGKTMLWEDTTEVTRTTFDDALVDAMNLKEDITAFNLV